jgi:hypothetical protein
VCLFLFACIKLIFCLPMWCYMLRWSLRVYLYFSLHSNNYINFTNWSHVCFMYQVHRPEDQAGTYVDPVLRARQALMYVLSWGPGRYLCMSCPEDQAGTYVDPVDLHKYLPGPQDRMYINTCLALRTGHTFFKYKRCACFYLPVLN